MLLRGLLLALLLAGLAAAYRPVAPVEAETYTAVFRGPVPPAVSRMDERPPLAENDTHYDEHLASRYNEFMTSRDETGARTYGGYASPERVLEVLRALNGSVPGHLVRVGASAQGREILGFRFTQCVGGCRDRPHVLLVGDIHGDEVVGGELLFRLAQEYHYATINNLASRWDVLKAGALDVTIVPMFNPDGFVAGRRETSAGADLNRSFHPDRCGTEPNPTEPATEAEAMKAFLLAQQPHVLLVLHGGASVISVPYDDDCGRHGVGNTVLSPEHKLHVQLAHEFADGNPVLHGRVINGAYWYSLFGGLQDYAFRPEFDTVVSLTAELASVKWPSHAIFEQYLFGPHADSLTRFLSRARAGAYITVRDEVGRPVETGTVAISGDAARKYVRFHDGHGFRPLPFAATPIVVRAPGMLDATVMVTVTEEHPVVSVEVTLRHV